MSVLPDPDPLLAAFVRALREVDPDVTAVEIADALFLAARVGQELPPTSKRASGGEALVGDSLTSPPPGGAGAIAPEPANATDQPGGGAAGARESQSAGPRFEDGGSAAVGGPGGLYADVRGDAGTRARRVRAPAGRALLDPLGVARALRPLMRRVPSRTHVSLDVEATVEHVASLRLSGVRVWFPILRPEPERWLTVDLLVDVAPTMAPWQETVDELHHLLEGSGGFRAVRRWGWDTTAPGRPRPFYAEAPARTVARLPSTDGERVVLTVTDCLGRMWRDGTAFAYLAEAGATSSVALVQMLPRHLWSRTALGDHLDARVRAATPAAPNRFLPVEPLATEADDLLAFLAAMDGPAHSRAPAGVAAGEPPAVPIPVTMLEGNRLAPWARLVAGRAGPPVVAVLAAPTLAAAPAMIGAAEVVPGSPGGGTATRRLVEAFRGYASPGGRQLAVYLTAAAPLTLSIMRVVRDALIRDPSESHIAELLMSGLLRGIPGGRPRDPAFDWIPDAQRQLAFALKATDLARVTTAVTEWMNARVGSPREMTALTPDPTGAERLVITERTLPFAQQHAGKLRELGEDAAAARLTSRLEEHQQAVSPRGLEFQRSLRGHAGEIFRMAWAPDGRWLATPSVDGTIRLWDGATDQPSVRLSVSGNGINEITWSPDGAQFAAACYDGHLRAWSVATDGRRITALSELQGHGTDVRGASWSPAGDVIAAGCESGLVRLWSTKDWRSMDVHPAPEDGAAVSLAWSPDGALLAVGFGSGTVGYVRRGPDAQVAFLDTQDRRHDGAVTALRWAPRGRLVVTGHDDGRLIVRDSTRRSPPQVLAGHDDTITALTFSPDGQVLVSKAMDGRVRFWRADTWELFAELAEPSSNFVLAGLAWNPRRAVLATLGARDRSVRVWHVDMDRLLPTPVVLPMAGPVPVATTVEPDASGRARDHALVIAGHAPDPAPVDAAAPHAYRWLGWLVDPDGGGLSGPNVRLLTGDVERADLLLAPPWEAVNSALAEVLEAAGRDRAAGKPRRRLYVYFSGHATDAVVGPSLLFSRGGRGVSAVPANELLQYLRAQVGDGRFQELVVLIDGLEVPPSTAETLPAAHPPLLAEPPASSHVPYFCVRHIATAPEVGALTKAVLEGMGGPAADPTTHDVTSTSLGIHLATHPLVRGPRLEVEQSREPIVFRNGVTAGPTTVVLRASDAGTAQISTGGVPLLQVPVTREGDTIVHLAPGSYHLRHDPLGFTTAFVVAPGPAVQSVEIARPRVSVATASGFTLEAFKAGHGSAFLIRYGPSGAPRFALFDGGPATTYRRILQPRLEALRSELSPDAPLPLELVAVSHGDDDSIRGILDLLTDMHALREDRRPPVVRIEQLWYNDFGSLLDRTRGAGRPGARTLSLQSRKLQGLAAPLGVPMNMGAALVTATARGDRPFMIAAGLAITVLGPSERQIQSIVGLSGAGEPDRAFAERPDLPVESEEREGEHVLPGAGDRWLSNVLSLVLLLEFHGRAMLLGGDARGDDIVAALRNGGRMRDDQCHVDLMVVPHHGSRRNVSPEFFRRVLADHYVFTGRGAPFMWPAPEAVEMVLEARGDAPFTIHFNHAPAEFATSYPLRPLLDRFEADRNAGKRYQVRFASPDAPAVSVDLEVDGAK